MLEAMIEEARYRRRYRYHTVKKDMTSQVIAVVIVITIATLGLFAVLDFIAKFQTDSKKAFDSLVSREIKKLAREKEREAQRQEKR